MREAFSYMFKDNKFWIKALSYLGFVFVSNFLLNYAKTLAPSCPNCAPPLSADYWICYFLGTILSLIPLGYIYSTTNAIINQEGNIVLPYINIWKNLLKGFKYSIALLLLIIPFSLLSATIIVIGSMGARVQSLVLSMLILISSIVLLIAMIIIVLGLLVGFNWLFAYEDTWTNFYKFKKLLSMINANKKQYLICFGLVVLVCILTAFFEGFFYGFVNAAKIGTVPSLLIAGFLSAIIGTYAMYVNSYITAKSIKA